MTTTEETYTEACDYYVSRFGNITRLLRLKAQAQELCHDDWAQDILERIEEKPLSVEAQTIDLRNETVVWEILLGTGGPADRVLVTTDYRGTVEDAVYQYQNWVEPLNQDRDAVREFAEVFYYQEVGEIVAGFVPGVLR